MAPRFDPENLKLEVGVADLVTSEQRTSLGFAQRGGYERMWVGQAIHRRYQEEMLARDGSYRSEVGVSRSLIHRGWEIVIRGRIDGLRRDSDGTHIVEEIKSVRDADLAPPVREMYEAQAQVYAWMLGGQVDEPVRAELVLIEIGSGGIDREALAAEIEEVGRRIKRRLTALIRAYEQSRMAAERRREAAGRLTFPYAEQRPGQDRIIERVGVALERGEQLLLEAPTGIGKTVAALFPVLRYALEHEKRVFVLTAKTLQQEMAVKVLHLLNPDSDFHSLRLRAKAKMCANGEVICHEEFCRFAKGYFQKIQAGGILHQLLAETGTLTPDLIYSVAERAEVCPFEVSLELTGHAQVVVCDYNYAFDPYVALHHFAADNELDDVVLVIDEVHNLVERGRDYYSPELSTAAVQAAITALGASRADNAPDLVALCQQLDRLLRHTIDGALQDVAEGQAAAETAFSEEEYWDLRTEFDQGFVQYVEQQRENASFRSEDPFVDLYFKYLRFLDGLVHPVDGAFSHYVERRGDGGRVKVFCKDPSAFLGKALERTHALVGLSATLSPPEFYGQLLGLDPDRAAVERLPSPFPRENRRFVLDATVSTLYRDRAANYEPIAERIAELARSVPGNCLVLFPSYAFLNEVAERLPDCGKQVLMQQVADSDERREEVLDSLRSPLLGDVLLLAVAGGVFAEGVDYPGEILRAVTVVGPCLPPVSLERDLLRSYYQDRFERGFEYAFVVPGMTRVIQAAGRLIRSADDTGVIALLDKRFLRPPYRHHIPGDWAEQEDLNTHVGDPGAAAREFFAGLVGA